MGWLLLICWILSPFVLIPVAIVNSNKAKKYKQFLQELRRQNRISLSEEKNLYTDHKQGSALNYPGFKTDQPTQGGYVQRPPQQPQNTGTLNYPGLYADNNKTVQPTPVQPKPAAQPVKTAAAAAAPVKKVGVDLLKPEDRAKKNAAQQTAAPAADINKTPAPVRPVAAAVSQNTAPKPANIAQQNELMKQRIAAQQQMAANGAQPKWIQPPEQLAKKPEKKFAFPKIEFNSTTILFGIGIIFMILTGIIFSTAYWVDIGYVARVGVLVFEAVVFFAMHRFTGKKLKIEGTSSVMYLLGSVFSVISYLTTGYFGLFGAWFGFEGKGMMAFLSLGALMITFFSGRALKLFKKPLCEYIACISLALSGTLMLGQFSTYFENKLSAFAMFITIAGTSATAAYFYLKSKGTEISKAVRMCLFIVRILFAAITIPILLADLFGTDGATVSGWIICIIYMGESIWHAVRTGKEKWLYAHGAILLAGVISLGIAIDDMSIYAVILTVFSAASGWIYLYLEHNNKLKVKGDKLLILFKILFAAISFAAVFVGIDRDFEVIDWITAILFILDFTALAVYYKKQPLLIPQSIMFLLTVLELVITIDDNTSIEDESLIMLVPAIIGMVGTAVYNFLKKYKKKDLMIFNADAICVFVRIMLGLPALALVIFPFFGFEWDENVPCLITAAAYIAELTVYSILNNRRRELSFQNIFIFSLLAHFFIEADNKDVFVLISWAGYALATAVYVYLRQKGKLRFNADYTVIAVKSVITAMCVGFCIEAYPTWSTAIWLLCSLIAAETLFYGILFKNQIFIGVHALFISGILFESYFLLEDYAAFSLICLAVMTIGTLAYYHFAKAGKLRVNCHITVASMRTIFGIVCLGHIFSCGLEWSVTSLIIFAVTSAELLYYGIRERKELLVGFHVLSLCGVFFEIALLINDYDIFALICLAFTAITTAIYYHLRSTDKLMFRTDMVLAGTRSLFGVVCLTAVTINGLVWSPVSLTILAVFAAELLYYGIREKRELLIGLHAVMLTGVLFELGLLTNSFRYFALFCCIVAAAGTFAYTYLGKKDKLSFNTPTLLPIMRAVYGAICISLLTGEWLKWSWQSLVIAAITAIELTYHGLTMKNRLILRAQGVSMMALSGIAAYMLSTVIPGYYTGVFIFAILLSACLVIYHIYDSLYTKTTDSLFMIMIFGLGIYLMHDAAVPYGIIIMAFFMAFTVLDAFSKKNFLAKGMQIVMPVPAMLTAYMLANFLLIEYSMRCMGMSMTICAAVLCAAAFMTSFGRREDKKFARMKYSLETASGICLMSLFTARADVAVGIIAVIVSAALFSVMQSSKKNMHSLLPTIGVFLGATSAARAIWADPMRSGNAAIIFSIVMTALQIVISKLRFPNSFTVRNDNGKYHWDVPHLGILLCIVFCASESMMFSPRARLFIAILEMTAFAANFYRRNNSAAMNRGVFTAATALASLALILRPFMVFQNATVTTKVILVIIVLFGLAVKRIWRDEAKVSSELSQAVFMAAFVLLIVDGLMNQSLANSLIVLCTSLALLIYSFHIKSRRWFLISAATLLLLTLYTTGDFLATVAWWAYLLLAGLILIIVAAITEYHRQKGSNNEARFFVDWKW